MATTAARVATFPVPTTVERWKYSRISTPTCKSIITTIHQQSSPHRYQSRQQIRVMAKIDGHLENLPIILLTILFTPFIPSNRPHHCRISQQHGTEQQGTARLCHGKQWQSQLCDKLQEERQNDEQRGDRQSQCYSKRQWRIAVDSFDPPAAGRYRKRCEPTNSQAQTN